MPKKNFDKVLGGLIKEIILGMGLNYENASTEINTKIREVLGVEDLEGNVCTKGKITRYVGGETSIPILTLIGLCQLARKPSDELFAELYKKQGQTWENKLSKSLLPDRFVEFILDFQDDEDKRASDLASCLERGVIDSKFAYLGDSVAKKYLALIQSPEYSVHDETLEMLEVNVNRIVEKITESKKNVRIVSLGIGDGKKDAVMLDRLLQVINSPIEYLVFDISMEMIREGLAHIKKNISEKNFKKLKIKVFQMDFLYIDDIRDYLNSNTIDVQSLFLLLGNTLGNFNEHTLLDRINSVMQVNDYLLIDNQLKKEGKLSEEEKDELFAMYGTEKNREYISEILSWAKLTPSHGEILTTIKPEDEWGTATIVHQFITPNVKAPSSDDKKLSDIPPLIRKPIRVSVGGRWVSFSEVTVVFSKKYTKKGLKRILGSLYDIGKGNDFSTDEYALILCMKKE